MLLSAFFDLYVYNSTAGFPEYVCAYLFVYFANTKLKCLLLFVVIVEKINNLFLLFLVTDFIASSSDFNMDTASKNIFFSDFRTFGLYQKFRFVARP